MDSKAVNKAPTKKTHKGLGNLKQRYTSLAAAKSQAAGGKALHNGQPKRLGGSGLKTGHSKTNT